MSHDQDVIAGVVEPVSKTPARKAKTKRQKLRGQMAPFSRDSLQLIRASMKAKGAIRDLALLNLGVDSMLRCGDLLALRVADVRDWQGRIKETFPVLQRKTGEPVLVILTPRTREALAHLISSEDKWTDDHLFSRSGDPHGPAISAVRFRKLVKAWCVTAHLDPARHSGHSLRRTKSTVVYRETRHIEACRQMLGHRTVSATAAYLGVAEIEVESIARRFDI